MTLSNIGNDIFIGDSAATSHMTQQQEWSVQAHPD